MKKLIILAAILTFVPFMHSYAEIPQESVYLHQNLHYVDVKGDLKASYANFTGPHVGHGFIPVNTKVTLKKWGRKGLKIYTSDGGKMVYFEFHEGRMGMSLDEYVDLITGQAPFPLLTLSPIDQKGVKEGKALRGMSKEGVRVALGYPASHATPSLESSTWYYWVNRFGKRAITFSGEGTVIELNPDW